MRLIEVQIDDPLFEVRYYNKTKEQQIIGIGPIICCSKYLLWTKSAKANESVIEILKLIR